jgi:alpha-L-fucosidase
MELYFASVGRNANLLLNVPPTREGLFHEADVQRLREFGEYRTAVFAEDHAVHARVRRTADTVEFDLVTPKPISMVTLSEKIEHGQRVARYRVEGHSASTWTVLSRGTTIGHKKIDRFPTKISGVNEAWTMAFDRIRVVIEEAIATPQLGPIGLYMG